MKLHSFNAAVLALVLVGLVVPTGAAVSGALAVDDLWAENDVVLTPSDGPNGEYATVGEDGNLSIDLRDPGVNDGGETVIADVVRIENRGETAQRVWLTHEGSPAVTLVDSSTGEPIAGADHNVTLVEGAAVAVGIRIDTRGEDTAAGDLLLDSITLHAAAADPTEPPENGSDGGSGGGGDGDSGAAPATPVPTEQPTEAPPLDQANDSDVEVEFEEGSPDRNVTVRAMDPDTLDGNTTDPDPRPQAVISPDDSAGGSAGGDGTDGRTRRIDNVTVDAVTTAGEPITLTGTRSTVDTVADVDSDRRIVKVVDITAPPGRENQPATVRMRVARDKLEGTPPEAARIGHRTDSGWQLLGTRVVSTADGSVVLEARTDGFSPFAVFRSPGVTYEWRLPNGTAVSKEQLRSTFDEPGFYNVSLTVRDANGDQDTTNYRILANDRPTVTLDSPANVSVGEPVPLRANVSNRYGNHTVTWHLPNGTERTGEALNYTFTGVERTVRVTVQDEFGANSTTEETFLVGAPGAGGGGGQLAVVGESFPVGTWLALFGIVAGLLGTVYWASSVDLRWVLALLGRRSGDDGPRVTAFENPSWNRRLGLFEVGHLRVEDPTGDLDRIDLALCDGDGNELARKRIEPARPDVYSASPERIPGVGLSADGPGDLGRDYSVSVRAVDAADNVATFSGSTFRVDRRAPVATDGGEPVDAREEFR
ncbi:PKD domain-containing protein [Halorarum halobium]|uniref:PKD domain-containing protein n=1 Tax=Halorarum halobium TaxID=3075121 RepID=UPI0028B06D11|nr:PKD domain-containing protein [Halobaculum sp. XH14]